MRRVNRHNLAIDQPVKEMTECGKPLLDTRCRELVRRRFKPGCDPFG
jgi:hypothetical protein